ncbi:MFS transporter [Flavihumibacter rivuli]|uniref:MFS transporter n=1 Tax=Flavihumibacter rivuli TaxID=2838156 RepID=UPI001BDE992A|nr:MFS transporter [Flavihumibacter rivuli]ULQ56338.1 MFS transporter [Flavihumibacter rivuli]
MSAKTPIITKPVWILSFVSLFTDFASEMLYPVVPVYLKEIGFSVALIGLLEGLAELTVGISKGYFGKRSDETGLRLPFVKLGYGLSALSKPMMAMFSFPFWIFLARTTDRLGKGIRTAARDALLAQASDPSNRARVFSFHRSWDTVGAVLGPLTALAFLHFAPGHYKELFYLAFIPGIIAVALIFLLKETPGRRTEKKGGFFSYFGYWKEAGWDYKRLLVGLLVFALANSSDAFLLLQAREVTQSDSITIGAYIFYNLVYAISAYPMGILADKWGKRGTFMAGLLLFILVYTGFAFVGSATGVFILFTLYGLYAAATEGIAKAWISNLATPGQTATSLGLYNSTQSLCTLLASTFGGILWTAGGASFTFLTAAILAGVSLIYFTLAYRGK